MYTQFPIAALTIAVVWFETEWAGPILAAVLIAWASAFYFLTYNLVAGLSQSALNLDDHWKNIWTTRLIHVTAALGLFMLGNEYLYVVCFVAPWLIVNVATDTLNFLVQIDYLHITDNSDDYDYDEDERD